MYVDIYAEAVCLYKRDGSQVHVVPSLACACREFLCGITAFVWNKYPCCCFRHPCVLFDYKIPTTKNIRNTLLISNLMFMISPSDLLHG